VASAAYERRDAAARAAGYRSYYDYRVHGHGTVPAGEPVTGSMRQAFRGHAGGDLRDLLADIAARGAEAQVSPLGTDRDRRGRWREVDVLVQYVDRYGRVRERSFRLRGRAASTGKLKTLGAAISASGAGLIAAPSIDVFADVSEAEAEAA
jgi:hypothetical protein